MRVFLVAIVVLVPAFLAAQEVPLFHSTTSLVHVTVTVTDRDGRPVNGIRREDLKLFDNGTPREIQYFGQETNSPLTLGLVVDLSGSQVRFWEQHRDNVRRFIGQVLGPNDRAFLVSVPAMAFLVTDLTGSQRDLFEGVDSLGPRIYDRAPFGGPCIVERARNLRAALQHCGTLLWNGVWASAKQRMQTQEGRKALIVMSDGMDTGSQHTLEETIEAAQSADTPVFSIVAEPLGPAGWLAPGAKFAVKRKAGQLRKLSEETGGRHFNEEADSSDIFKQIESELRSLYVLGFTLPEADHDGKFHKLEVKSARSGLKVRFRKGYVADH